ncbi:trypsin-like peptidase domain-containing protein [Roseibacillus ishigakijimensis]|uniref:Trypsin-like peptidase domain-containing protein n=1 Tax=Roseibacillus ishigakijimensis TaxID=454146 RepID=A0A934VJI5_9BACT|nr:trypsin-like peptidase domain-containing protein [Roseibacillus ishigakijimensis]MBK1832639.1 trypsin-like peptidase domain-containing protein [Roseibacillus ishigakijimensis]
MRILGAFLFLLAGLQAAAGLNLRELQASLWPVVEQARKATVAVGALGSTGSGVVVSPEGLVLTAGHVITNLDTGEVATEVSVLFDDGLEARAKVLGMNRRHDAAMLQLLGAGPWDFAPLGDSDSLRPGEWVVATGHPSGYDALRAAPIRFGRLVSKSVDYFIGSDCVLFGGDSGGPLFDLAGKVVGIHSWIGEDVQTNTHAGISGFRRDWERLQAGERWGTLLAPPTIAEGAPVLGVMFDAETRGQQVVLDAVLAESAAERAGLRAGDILTRIDGQLVSGASLKRYLQRLEVGDEITVEFQRGPEERLARVTLGQVSSLPFVTEEGRKLLEAQAAELFTAFGQVTSELGSGVVRLFADGLQVGFGTVWTEKRILAKWSELRRADSLVGVDSEGREFLLTVQEIFAAHDLVVLQMPSAIELRPIAHAGGPARAGSLLAAVRPDGVPEGVGVLSVAERSLLESARGYLGVSLDEGYDRGGAFVEEVFSDSAAEEAGLEIEDVIVAVDDRPINGLQELQTVLSRAGPGQVVKLEVRRRTGPVIVEAKLKSRPSLRGRQSRRERMMDSMDERGLSRVRDSFPSVLQTDMTLAPEESGLPVVDWQGRLVGMAIARAGRVKTYLLPVQTLADLLDS